MSSRASDVARAIRESANGPLVRAEGLDGFSGERLVSALQRIARLYPPERSAYLEVGVFRGLTLLSVAHANGELSCLGIDDFSQFDRRGENRSIFESRRAALGASNARVIDADYERALDDLETHLDGRRVGLYFVDGPHDYRSQRTCLDRAVRWLDEEATVVIDDANYRHVRQATYDFLRTRDDFHLVCEAYTSVHPMNAAPDAERAARRGFWNGVHVLVRGRAGALAPHDPLVDPDRSIYFADHLVHSSSAAPIVTDLLDLVQPLLDAPTPRNVGRSLRGLLALGRSSLWRLGGRRLFRTANTYSEGLPALRMHPDL